MNRIALAADLGGTNLRVAAIAADGSILARARTETPKSGGAEEIVDAIVGLAVDCRDQVAGQGEIVSFGLAVPAVLNTAEGKIHTSPNLPVMNGLHLSKAIGEKLNIPVVLENDATAAAIGEQWLGASRGYRNSICVTLGTGVGGGIILDGKPLRGVDGTAGEIGHICVEPFGVPCGCGSIGCLEQYSSASAIVRQANELFTKHPTSKLRLDSDLTPKEVFEAGNAGDPLAIEVFRTVGFYLGIALAGLVNVLNPEVIVIGGGASAGWELFIPETKSQIMKRAFQQPAERVKLLIAELGDDAGILGASHLALMMELAKSR
ncbi:MAG: ROK family protein [Blastocatellia bacterium]